MTRYPVPGPVVLMVRVKFGLPIYTWTRSHIQKNETVTSQLCLSHIAPYPPYFGTHRLRACFPFTFNSIVIKLTSNLISTRSTFQKDNCRSQQGLAFSKEGQQNSQGVQMT